MDKEQILIKHLKTMLKRTKQSYVTVEQMKETPEYKVVLNAMDEMETELVKNNAVLHGVRLSLLDLDKIKQQSKAYANQYKTQVSSEGLENIADDFQNGARWVLEFLRNEA